jgi:hypothetical protein
MAMLGLDASRFRSTLDSAKSQAASAGSAISSSLGHHVMGAIGGVASVGFLEEAVRHTVEYGEQVAILSRRLGIGTDAVQSWDYALKQNGSSLESQAKVFERLAQARMQALRGNETQIASFKALGLTIDDLKHKRLEDLALQIAEAFKEGDPQKLIGYLRDVGGRGAGEMVAAFRGGLAELVGEAKGAGVVMSEEIVASMEEASQKSKKLWMEFTAGLAPAISGLMSGVSAVWHEAQIEWSQLFTLARTGSLKAAMEVRTEMREQLKEDELAEKQRRERAKGGHLVGGADEEENKKAERAADLLAKRKEELAERLAKLQEKHYVDSLSKEERITELHRKRAELAGLLADNWAKMSEENRLKAEIDVEELKGEEERAQRDLDKPKHTRAGQGLARNSLQAIGAYGAMAPHEQQMLDVTHKSEGHLREIKEHLVKGQHVPSNRGVHF